MFVPDLTVVRRWPDTVLDPDVRLDEALVAEPLEHRLLVALYRPPQQPAEPLVVGPDYSLVGSALGLTSEAAALTGGEGAELAALERHHDPDDVPRSLAIGQERLWMRAYERT